MSFFKNVSTINTLYYLFLLKNRKKKERKKFGSFLKNEFGELILRFFYNKNSLPRKMGQNERFFR